MFHNHLSIEAVLPVFGYDEPAFERLVTMLRQGVISEVAKSELPGVIFTFVWSFSHPEDLAYVEALRDIFESENGRVVYVELWADLETRLERNESPSRLEAKSSKRDVDASRAHMLEAEDQWKLSSEGNFPLSPHLLLDNSSLSAADAAEIIADHFGLKQLAPDP